MKSFLDHPCFVYLASPYDAHPRGRDEAYNEVLEFVVNHAKDKGLILFSPIVYGHHLESFGVSLSPEKWIEFDLALLQQADVLAVLKLDGWEESTGVKAEIVFAQKCNIPIEYIEWYIR